MQAAPLAIAADAEVRARMERAAAAAQVRLDFIDEPTVGEWTRAPAVLASAAAVQHLAELPLPRRDSVIVVADQPMTSLQWQACVALGAGRIVTADDADYELVQLLSDAADTGELRAPGLLIAVVGACGGAGGSVFASALALTAAEDSRRAVLIDADREGPGLEVLLGMEQVPGARWTDIAASHGRIPDGAMWRALPAVPGGRGKVALLGFGAGAEHAHDGRGAALDAVLESARRGGDDAVVDVPRTADESTDRIVARADLTALVLPAEVRGCYAAARLAPRLADTGARLGLVVRGPAPGGVGADDVAAALDLPLIAAMRPQPGLARAIDIGAGIAARMRGPLRKAAAVTLDYARKQA